MKSRIPLFLVYTAVLIVLVAGMTTVSGSPGDVVAVSEAKYLNGSACYGTTAGTICFQSCGSTSTDKGSSGAGGNSATWEQVQCYGTGSCKQYIYVVGTDGCSGS